MKANDRAAVQRKITGRSLSPRSPKNPTIKFFLQHFAQQTDVEFLQRLNMLAIAS